MTQYQTEAILLAVKNWGEADKMVTLFSREYGKISAIAYGARRPKSRLTAGMQPFMHISVALTPGKNLDCIKQYDTIRTFREIRENFDFMVYGAFIAELTIELCPERQPEPLVFDLLESILKLISKRNSRVVASAGAWQMLVLAGILPCHKNCSVCNKELTFPAYFSVAAGGALCDKCRTIDSVPFSAAASNLLDKLINLDWQSPGNFSISGSALVEVEKLFTNYLRYHIDKPLKSLEFIKELAIER